MVAKLFGVVVPDVACFGEKDYQQLRVIEAMTVGLCLPIRIEACGLVRDEDGLALSSRNVYLSEEERGRALSLSGALGEAARLIAGGQRDARAVEAAMRGVMEGRGVEVDYAVVREPRKLSVVEAVDLERGPVVCLVAGRVGAVRLIDNRVVGGGM